MSCILKWHFATTHLKVRKQRHQQKKNYFEQKTDKYMKQWSGLINFAAIADKTSSCTLKCHGNVHVRKILLAG